MTKPYSEHTAQLIDEEVRNLVAGAYDRTLKIIEEHKNHVEAVGLFYFRQIITIYLCL